MVDNIAIIPARSGSKRIKKKNIIEFHNKPMIAWTIEAALNSCLFNNVYVDTDCEEIADISIKYGAEVPFLRDQFIDDFSTVSQSTSYFIENLSKRNIRSEYVVQLMANCPLRTSKTIKEAFKTYIDSPYDFQISCFNYGWMNPRWALELDKNRQGKRIFNNDINKRSQDFDKLFCPSGAIWIGKTKTLLNCKNFYTDSLSYFEVDWKEALDIDEYQDLEMAEAVFLMMSKRQKDT